MFLRMQIRSNAPEADVIVMGLPDNVLAGYKTAAARQNFVGNLTTVVGDLRDSGFQRLHYLPVPSSVMTVRHSASIPLCFSDLLRRMLCTCLTESLSTSNRKLRRRPWRRA